MKNLKKMMALAIAMIMTLAMGITAFAEDSKPDISDTNGNFSYSTLTHDDTTSSLTVKNIGETSHTFELYQIFVGDVTPTDPETNPATATLSNITWGSGITSDGQAALGDASTKAKTLTDAAKAKAFADALMEGSGGSSYLTGANEKTVEAGADAIWTGLNPGYYLVIDKVNTQDGSDKLNNSAYTAYIMQVVGTVTRNAKLDVPSVEKKVQDTNDSLGASATANAADYDDDGKIWKDSADHDVGDVITYKLTGTLPTNYDEYERYYYAFHDIMQHLTPVSLQDENMVIYGLNGTEKINIGHYTVAWYEPRKELEIEFDDLKKNANVTKDTKIVVEYKVRLDEDAVIGADGNPNEVYLRYSNNPNQGGNVDKGQTPKDLNKVFTYTIEVNKITGETALPGAAFALYKKYVGTLPTGKTAVTEIKYDNGKKTYAIPENEQWVLVGQKTAGEDTKFDFERVDDGEYLLVETTTPAGYNSVKPMQFKVEAKHDAESDNPTLTSVTGTDTHGTAATLDPITLGSLTVSGKLSGVSTNINNESGSVLPSTGGMGTTIFYVLGTILVLGAGVLLITRRRMKAK